MRTSIQLAYELALLELVFHRHSARASRNKVQVGSFLPLINDDILWQFQKRLDVVDELRDNVFFSAENDILFDSALKDLLGDFISQAW